MAETQNTDKKPFDKKIADALWKALTTTITFRKSIHRWPSHGTYGFVDIHMADSRAPGNEQGWRNVVARISKKGNFYLAMPIDEEARKAGKGRFPYVYPLTAELRAVLTQRVQMHPEVVEAIKEFPSHPVQSGSGRQDVNGASPFEGDEGETQTTFPGPSPFAQGAGDPGDEDDAPVGDEPNEHEAALDAAAAKVDFTDEQWEVIKRAEKLRSQSAS